MRAEEGCKKQKEKGSEVKVMTDVMCPFSSATRHLLHASSVFTYLFDILSSPSSIWNNVSLYAVHLIFIFFSLLRPLYVMCFCALDATSCAYISGVISINLFPLYRCFPLFLTVCILFSLYQRLDVVTPCTLLFFVITHFFAVFFFSAQIWYTVNIVTHLNVLFLSAPLLLLSRTSPYWD